MIQDEYTLSEVTLERQALGFGFRIVGGTEEGSQVTVGHIVPGGAADCDPRIATGDEILSIDGHNVVSIEIKQIHFSLNRLNGHLLSKIWFDLCGCFNRQRKILSLLM